MKKFSLTCLILLSFSLSLKANDLVSARVQDQSISWVLGGYYNPSPELFTQYVEVEDQTVTLANSPQAFNVQFNQGTFTFDQAVRLQVFNVQGELLFQSTSELTQWSPSEHGVSHPQLYLVYRHSNHSVQSSSWIQP